MHSVEHGAQVRAQSAQVIEDARFVDIAPFDSNLYAIRVAVQSCGGAEIAFDRRGVKAVLDLEVATTTWQNSIESRLGL